MTILDNVKYQFKAGGMYLRLVYINVGLFAILGVIHVFASLMKVNSTLPNLMNYLGLNTDIEILLWRPHTLITYMFTHFDFWHILSNMLMLFFLGRLFEGYVGTKKVLGIYVVGGIVGGILQVAAKNSFPVFSEIGHYPIVGASGAVMAIAAALVTYAPQLEIMLFGIVRIKIVWIVLLFLLQDFFQMHQVGSGIAHFAHLGGALWGFIYIANFKKGKDYLQWFDKIMSFFTNPSLKKVFKSKSKLKVSYSKIREDKPPRDDYQFNEHKQSRQERLDVILDKIKHKGYEGLTKEEKDFLASFK
jgi:membrane associated rhomboid family serine protease